MRRLVVLAMAAALCVALAVPASAGTAVERPYKATEVGSATVVIDESCVFGPETLTCPVATVGTSNITHLGKSDTTSEGLITIYFFETCTLLDGVTEGQVFTAGGTSEIVAANGDRLFGTYENQGCAGDAAIGNSLVGSQTITGGTGRFEGATGSAVYTSAVSINDVFELHVEGTITY